MNRTPSPDENNTHGHSHRMIVIRNMINMGLYWPLWWANEWILSQGLHILWSSLGKGLFYANLLFILIGWYLIAKGKPEIDKDVIKFSLFIIFILVLMEIPVWLYVFSTGQG